jgi:nucleolar protein 16
LTLSQNYKRLGLRSKLGNPAGGVEKVLSLDANEQDQEEKPEDSLEAGEGRIIRHEDGTVTVEYGHSEESDDEQELEPSESSNVVIQQLEQLSRSGITKPRLQSDREQDWIRTLVEKHGDDYEAMMWDKKLNIYQQSQGDLKKRVKKWLKSQQHQ